MSGHGLGANPAGPGDDRRIAREVRCHGESSRACVSDVWKTSPRAPGGLRPRVIIVLIRTPRASCAPVRAHLHSQLFDPAAARTRALRAAAPSARWGAACIRMRTHRDSWQFEHAPGRMFWMGFGAALATHRRGPSRGNSGGFGAWVPAPRVLSKSYEFSPFPRRKIETNVVCGVSRGKTGPPWTPTIERRARSVTKKKAAKKGKKR